MIIFKLNDKKVFLVPPSLEDDLLTFKQNKRNTETNRQTSKQKQSHSQDQQVRKKFSAGNDTDLQQISLDKIEFQIMIGYCNIDKMLNSNLAKILLHSKSNISKRMQGLK
jgi:esterase/lipase